jgi:hypothetical protein
MKANCSSKQQSGRKTGNGDTEAKMLPSSRGPTTRDCNAAKLICAAPCLATEGRKAGPIFSPADHLHESDAIKLFAPAIKPDACC